MINGLSHGVSVIALIINPQYQPSALGLIMGSRVDTSGDNQNAVRSNALAPSYMT